MTHPSSGPVPAPVAIHLRAVVPLGLAVSAFGVTFGVLASAAGVTLAQAMALSLLTFTGASQFAAVGVLAAGGTSTAAMTGALLLAARNTLYGVALARYERGGWLRRLIGAQLVIDETAAFATAQTNEADARRALWVTGLTVGVGWNIGTFAGVIFGQAIGDPLTWGLDAAFPAAFLALLAPQVRERANLVAALTGGVIALAMIPLAPPGVPIIAAALGILPAWLLRRRARP